MEKKIVINGPGTYDEGGTAPGTNKTTTAKQQEKEEGKQKFYESSTKPSSVALGVQGNSPVVQSLMNP
jgi:hypothetical protein